MEVSLQSMVEGVSALGVSQPPGVPAWPAEGSKLLPDTILLGQEPWPVPGVLGGLVLPRLLSRLKVRQFDQSHMSPGEWELVREGPALSALHHQPLDGWADLALPASVSCGVHPPSGLHRPWYGTGRALLASVSPQHLPMSTAGHHRAGGEAEASPPPGTAVAWVNILGRLQSLAAGTPAGCAFSLPLLLGGN